MNLFRTCAFKACHNLFARRSANDGIVYKNDSFILYACCQRIELEPDSTVALGLRGINEASSNIAVLNKARNQGDTASRAVSMVITPSVMVKAPVIQPLTHNGSLQCLHETAKLMPLPSSILIFGLILISFSALAMSLSFVPAKAQ